MTRDEVCQGGLQSLDGIHPEVRRAMEAIDLPEVQEMMKRLADYGLGIAVPHMHGDDGEFVPLPKGKVAVEDGLVVSFKDVDDPEVESGIPVVWQWDGDPKVAAKCKKVVCFMTCHSKKRNTQAIEVNLSVS